MQDHFIEEVVVKRNNGLNRALYMLSWVIIGLSGLTAAFMLSAVSSSISQGQFHWPSLVMLLLCGGICAYTYFFHDKLLTEYEYTFTNGSLDFAEVYNNKKRKSLGSLNVRNVEAFGKVNSEDFKRYVNMPGIKRMNWFLNRDAELYYFYFTKEQDKKMIILEPSEEMVANIRHYVPASAWRV
ncbi:MAG: hypothetical protein ABTB30_02170 [Clostridia bacterium]|jgi:hypothetical protein|nr:hypothetical protein [Clostridia bacterium]